MFGRDEFANNLRLFLERNGLDPFYTATIFCILITLGYWKEFKHWDSIRTSLKGLAGSALFASVSFSIISILRLIGVINF